MAAAHSQTFPKCLPLVTGQGDGQECKWMNGYKFILTTGKVNWSTWSTDSDAAAKSPCEHPKIMRGGYNSSLGTNVSHRRVRNCSVLLCRVAANDFREDLCNFLNGKQVTSLYPPILLRLGSPAFQNCRLSSVWTLFRIYRASPQPDPSERNYFWGPFPVQCMGALTTSQCDEDITSSDGAVGWN